MPLAPLDAYEEVMRFSARRGKAALCLAMHAAMPQVLRVELLHLLRLNFVPEAIDDAALEADVLFAPFCESLGNGYYRFDAHARRHLVKHLDGHYQSEPGDRSRRVASFLLSYFDEQRRLTAESNDVVYAAYVEVERWVALAFFDPDIAARQLASALSRAAESGPAAARFRFAGLASAVTTPFAGRQSLLAYTEGIEALERGDIGSARDILEPLGDAEMMVAGVSLPAPARVLREWVPDVPEKDPGAAVDGGADAETEESLSGTTASAEAPQETSTRPRTLFVSFSRRDRRWADELARFVHGTGRDVFLTEEIISGGDRLRAEIDSAIDHSRTAIVLVSQYYLASESCEEELGKLLRLAASGQIRLAWALVSHCAWHDTPLARYQAAHDVARPLSELRAPQRERVFAEIAQKLVQLDSDGAPPQGASPRRIFVCYRRDYGPIVTRITDRMRQEFGDDVLFDHADSLEVGLDFWEQISAAIRSTEMMLVFIGRDWSREGRGGQLHRPDDFVHREIAAALDRDVRVVPILLDAPLPVPDQLPHDIRPLASRHALVIREPYTKDSIDRLVREVSRIWRRDPPSEGDPDVAPTVDSMDADTSAATVAVRVYCVYAHEDQALRDELSGHLKILERRGLISVWHDRDVKPGEDWQAIVGEQMRMADLILLLVSKDFIQSDYIFGNELTVAMQRHQAGFATVVPIIVRPISIESEDVEAFPFMKLPGLPTDMRPVTTWANRDEAWTDVVRGLRATVTATQKRKTGRKVK